MLEQEIAYDASIFLVLVVRTGISLLTLGLPVFDCVLEKSVCRFKIRMRVQKTCIRVAWLEPSKHAKIISSDFEHQLIVREKAKYYEPKSAVELTLQLGCLAIIGEPELQRDCIDGFGNKISRPSRFDEVLEYINAD